jgi:hypothetical protein
MMVGVRAPAFALAAVARLTAVRDMGAEGVANLPPVPSPHPPGPRS